MSDGRAAHFAPGDGTAMVTGRGIALVLAGIDTAACLMIDAALQSGVGLDRMMTSLSSLGFDALPDLAIAVAVADGVQLLHRGDVSLEIGKADGGIELFVSPKVTTWREEFVAGATMVRLLGRGAPETESHRLSAGVVPARQISWPVPMESAADVDSIVDIDVSEPAAAGAMFAGAVMHVDQSSESAVGAPDLLPELLVLQPLQPPPILPVEPPDVPSTLTGLPSLSAFAIPPLLPTAPPTMANATIYPADNQRRDKTASPVPARSSADVLAQPLLADEPDPLRDPLPEAVAVPSEADDLDFSNLVSHTVFRHVEDAAIRISEHEEPPSTNPIGQPGPTSGRSPTDAGNVTIMPEWTKPPAVPGAPNIISGIPQPGFSPVPGTGDGDGDHDGRTVARSRKKPSLPQAAASGGHDLQPMIQAVRCIGGHFNAPNAHQCRICSQAIIDRTQISTQRPALGVLRFSTNETVSVAGPILIGRNPPNGLAVDGETAAVVAIENGELSRFHAAIHLTEWFVHVADQASMNGTMVTAPGKPRQTLRPYEKVQISPGTVVELGGAVSFRFDAS